MLTVNRFVIAFICLHIVGTDLACGQSRVWQDPSGRYQVEGTLVASDQTMVVIENPAGELVVLQQAQLSKADQEYLDMQSGTPSTKLEDHASEEVQPPAEGSTAKSPSSSNAPADSSTENEDSSTSQTATDSLQSAKADRLEKLRTEVSTWHLRTGKSVEGELVGFGRQEYIILRREGALWVNGMNSKVLPAGYEQVIPAVVAGVDGQALKNLSQLEKHIAAGGAGPFQYVVAGVQLELAEGSVLTIPLELLESELAAQLEPGFARWQAAQGEGVAEEDRYATNRRERLLMHSLERLRRTGAAQARKMKLIELNLLSANAGLTDIWEVLLVPASPYGFPRSVVVPGRDSFTAQQIAAGAYPGWQVGPVRKLSN